MVGNECLMERCRFQFVGTRLRRWFALTPVGNVHNRAHIISTLYTM